MKSRSPKQVHIRRVLSSLLAGTLLLGAAESSALASGFLAARFGGEHGHPTTDDTSAAYYNPAGLALRTGTRITLNGVFAYRTASYKRPCAAIDSVTVATDGSCTGSANVPDNAIDANSGKGSLGNVIVSPFLGVASDLGVKNLGVALAFYAPFGGSADWGTNSDFANNPTYPGAVDGPQRWAAIAGTIRALYVTAAGAYRLPKQNLSFGLGLNVVLNSIDTLRARNGDGTDDLVDANGLKEGRSRLDVKGTTFSLGLGVIWQPNESTWLGLSYQSQPGFGKNTLSGTLYNKLAIAPPTDQKVEVTQSLPDIVRLGARHRRGKLEYRLFGEFVRWSVFDKQCVLDTNYADRSCATAADGSQAPYKGLILALDRQWKNAFGLRGGASYWVKPEVEVFGGLGYDGNAVPDKTLEAAFIDMDKITAAVGAKFDLMCKRVGVELTYTQVIYFSRTVDVRDRDSMGKQISQLPNSKNPDGGGTYKQSIGLLSASVEYRF